jgi:thiamine biosynthesis lipoprotein
LPPKVSAQALQRCNPACPVQTLGGRALGTAWQVRFAAGAEIDRDPIRAAIEQRLARIVDEMSQWEPGSLLSTFNRAPAGTWFTLPEDFATVMAAALTLAEQSGGAFDPTHGRAAALLGYGAEPVTRLPSAGELDEALSAAGWRNLAFDRAARRLRQPGGLWLDFSGIAKGYAVDAVADLLAAQGIADALVEIGGELVGRGLRPDGQPWWVDLEAPPGAALAPLRVGLHGQAVATSGDYVRGAHTIDPRTGRPLDARLASVSVIHDSAMLADAWATALTVLGVESGMELAARHGVAARFVERDDARFIETLSPALRGMIED